MGLVAFTANANRQRTGLHPTLPYMAKRLIKESKASYDISDDIR
jgi:hypothetical protein